MVSTNPPPADHANRVMRQDWFYTWVGLCLTRWGFVHEVMYELCRIAMDCSEKAAAIVFYKTNNFDARLTLTNELIEAVFPPLKPGEHEPAPLQEWHAIQKELLRLSPIRNVLAHQQPGERGEVKVVLTVPPGGTRAVPPPFVDLRKADHWLEVRLARSEAIRGRKVKVEAVRDTELPAHYADLEKALLKLILLKHKLSVYLASPEESALSESGHSPSP